MGCGCGRSAAGQVTGYRLTTQDGGQRVFLTQTEARIALQQAGGGTIETLRET